MFVATLSNGKTIVEGKDVQYFDECPDGITSMQLLMPHTIYKKIADKTLKRQAVLALGRYDKYYCAKQAIANVMAISGNVGQMYEGGQGKITHEVLAGIDLERNEVVYLELNVTTGDVTVDKFDYDWWIQQNNINPTIFKSGAKKPTPKK